MQCRELNVENQMRSVFFTIQALGFLGGNQTSSHTLWFYFKITTQNENI
jgi:hypothetical protein